MDRSIINNFSPISENICLMDAIVLARLSLCDELKYPLSAETNCPSTECWPLEFSKNVISDTIFAVSNTVPHAGQEEAPNSHVGSTIVLQPGHIVPPPP
mmetsp:Transcript_4055/g.5997  ORF Transcript_4055/g.5997 Transcript_4055/m.5997 type:complete len:99 (-) Transcript_4055:126-422(-)